MNSRVSVAGKPLFIFGANYPWMVVNGKSNYGLDFGVNRWGTHRGITTNAEEVEKDFAIMRPLGFNTLRWFVFTDGRGGIRFDEHNMPAELEEKVFDDFDVLLSIAAKYDIKLILSLLDFLWMHDAPQPDSPNKTNFSRVLKSEFGQDELIGRIFHPLFHRCAHHEAILAWEVMNEPDWVVEGLDVNRKNVREPMSLALFKSFVRKVSNAVHHYASSLCTVGGGRIKFIDVWDDEDLQLDFLQVHTYNDFLNHPWDGKLFGKNFNEMGVKRPLLIGEFSTNARSAFSDNKDAVHISLPSYLDFAATNNFAGCLYWSFKGVDKCGSEEQLALQHWSARNFIG
jgi:hypothetical protein